MAAAPDHEVTDITRAEVSALVSFGNRQEDIAKYLGISVDTLDRKYRYELDTSIVRANSVVANKLYRKATIENDLTAMIFWLKTRARWRETEKNDDREWKSVVEKLVDVINTKKPNE